MSQSPWCRFRYGVFFALGIVGCAASRSGEDVRSLIPQVERERLRALVDGDMEVADRLHADDFQLITPFGDEYSKEEYLGQIGTGELDYTMWEPGEITVRIYPRAAVIRYQDLRFEVRIRGEVVGSGNLHHTNLYEERDGRWQIVWSHASGAVRTP